MKNNYFSLVLLGLLAVVPFGASAQIATTTDTGLPFGCVFGYSYNYITGRPCATTPTPVLPPAICAEVFSRDLTVGSHGKDVAKLHEILAKEGFGIAFIPEDTNAPYTFTEVTAGEVVRFQAKYGIRQTGYVGPITRAKLNSLYPCDDAGYQKPIISEVRGIQSTYSQGENIDLLVRGIEPDGSLASSERGFNVQVYINAKGANASYAGVNGDYNARTGLWEVNIKAPTDASKNYELDVVLYCGRADNTYCGNKYENNPNYPLGAQVNKVFPFTVDGGSESNLPPVVYGISGPTMIPVGQNTTWFVRAADPERGRLTYSVRWGDEPVIYCFRAPCPEVATSGDYSSSQASFSHTYSRDGVYYPVFTITDNAGQSVQTSMSVTVGEDGDESGKSSIKVLSPNADVAWKAGGSGGVKFYTQGLAGRTMNIFIYTEDRKEMHLLSSVKISEDGNDSDAFAIPSWIRAGRYKIKLEATDRNNRLVVGVSNGYVDITNKSINPNININFPNGGENIVHGASVDIKWNKNFDAGSHPTYIDLIGSRGHFSKIASLDGSATSYRWTVPSNLPVDTYRIRVAVCPEESVSGYNCYKESAGLFNIIARPTRPFAQITSPNGGESYNAGDRINVRWTTSGENLNVTHIALADANGGFLRNLVTDLPGSQTSVYVNLPMDLATGQYKIRAVLCPKNYYAPTFGEKCSDDSDGVISVAGGVAYPH